MASNERIRRFVVGLGGKSGGGPASHVVAGDAFGVSNDKLPLMGVRVAAFAIPFGSVVSRGSGVRVTLNKGNTRLGGSVALRAARFLMRRGKAESSLGVL